jgi:ATP-dependent Clp protease ATP-binding subunit ClpA
MITKELQEALNNSVQEAVTRKHEYLTLEHLLYALIKDKTTSQVIRACGGNVEELRVELDKFLNESMEKLKDNKKQNPEPSAAFERVLSRAAMQAESSAQATIDGGNVLAAMFGERRSHAVYLLEKQGITRLDVLNFISHGISKFGPGPAGEEEEEGAPGFG